MAIVSIIVPVFNAEKYIERCLESLVHQSFPDIEIIIINDGSTDRSEQLCLEWKNRDNRIKYVGKRNEGAGPSRNLGIQIASAELIAFCDSDDWYDIKFIELMVAKQSETDADIVTCGRYIFNGDTNRVIGTIIPSCSDIQIDYWEHWQWRLVNSLCVKLIKRSLFIEYNIRMPAGHGEDTAIQYFIITIAKKVTVVEKPLYYYWFNRAGSSINSVMLHTAYTVKYMTYCWDLFTKAGLFSDYKKPLLLEAYSIISDWYPRIKDNVAYSKEWLSNCARAISSYFENLFVGVSKVTSKRIIGYGALGKSATNWLALLKGTPLYPTELWDIRATKGEVVKPVFSSLTKDDCLLCFPRSDIERELRKEFDNLDCQILYSSDIAQWYGCWMITNSVG